MQSAEKTWHYSKKKSLIYSEGDVEKQEAFINTIQDIPEEDLVYLDEAGFKESDGERTHAYAPRGERVFGHISGKRSTRQNVIAGLCNNEIIAPKIYKGTMNTLPKLRQGQIIIQDNASFHKISPLMEKALEKKECRILYLPPYSPQLNLIERLWGCMKKRLNRISDCVESLRTKLAQILEKRYFRLEPKTGGALLDGHNENRI